MQLEIRALGATVAMLIDELDMPSTVKSLLLQLSVTFTPEQQEQFIELLRQAVLEQYASESDPVYQSKVRELDKATNRQLQDLKDSYSK